MTDISSFTKKFSSYNEDHQGCSNDFLVIIGVQIVLTKTKRFRNFSLETKHIPDVIYLSARQVY